MGLITVWAGPLPAYLNLFLLTVAENPDVDLIFVADRPPPPMTGGLPANVRWEERSFEAIRQAVADGVGCPLPAVGPYKLCDYKPAFGIAFADLLAPYDVWGHVDCDLVLGDLRAFATPERLAAHEVLSFRGWGFVHGPLTLFRNTEPVNRLFERAEGWRETFADPTHHGFDEACFRWPWLPSHLRRGGRQSMTDAVQAGVAAGEIRFFDLDCVDETSSRTARPDLTYDRSSSRPALVDRTGARPVAYYHLLEAKDDAGFRLPRWQTLPDRFVISRRGVRAIV